MEKIIVHTGSSVRSKSARDEVGSSRGVSTASAIDEAKMTCHMWDCHMWVSVFEVGDGVSCAGGAFVAWG